MAGLIDVGILRPELVGSFAAGYQGAERARQQSQQAQQQIEMDRMKLDQLKQDRAMLLDLQSQLRAAGQSDDPEQFFQALIKSGNPDLMTQGYDAKRRYQELQRADALLRREAPELFPSPTGAAPGVAPRAAPTGAEIGGPVGPTPPGLQVSPEDKAYQAAADKWMMGGMQGPAPTRPGAGGPGAGIGSPVGPTPPGLQVSPEDRAYQQAADQWMMGGMQGPAPTRPGAAPVNALAPAAAPAAAPANALAAPPDRVQELRRKILALRSINDPRLKSLADQYENELKEITKSQVLAPGSTLIVGGQPRFTAAAAPTNLARLQAEMNALPPNDPRRAEYAALIRKETTHAPGTTVNLPAQEKAFESELGKGQADRILKSQAAAQDAAQILQTNQVGRDILKSGAITGAGADFFVGLNSALKQAGVDFGYADAAANSQAYVANMAQNVGKLIKQYGAGTGLSDADRDFATQAAGGKITLDEKAIRRILDINDRAANFVIDRHNKDVKNIKTNIPLAVEKPTFEPTRAPASAPPKTIPQAAIDALKAGRGSDAQFDEIFGPGAAKRVRGGK